MSRETDPDPDPVDLRLRSVVAHELFRGRSDEEVAAVAAEKGSEWSRAATLELARRRELAGVVESGEMEEPAVVVPLTAEGRQRILDNLGLDEEILADLGLAPPADPAAAEKHVAVPVSAEDGPKVLSSPPSTASRPHAARTR